MQHSNLTKKDIVGALRTLGLPAGSMVLVHSSLSSMGWVEGGAETVIDALLEAAGPAGTVIVPTLTGTEQDSFEHPPVFDPRVSPCWTGTIPETFRRRPVAVRSRHPTHSVACIGPAADRLIRGHEYCATPCAADSPYGRLAEEGGSILLLGVTHDSNTCLHMVEEMARVPYHMQNRPAVARVAREDGSWEEIEVSLHLWRWERNFPKVEPHLHAAGAQRDGYVGQALCRLIDARSMRDLLVPMLERDPLFLLSDTARAEYVRSMQSADRLG